MEDDTLTLQKMYFYLHPRPDKLYLKELKKLRRRLIKEEDYFRLKHLNQAIKALN